jgi:hypothetical protein
LHLGEPPGRAWGDSPGGPGGTARAEPHCFGLHLGEPPGPRVGGQPGLASIARYLKIPSKNPLSKA